MIELLKLFASFTPTEKDDEFIRQIEEFLDEHPEAALVLLQFFLKLVGSSRK